jgi:hypothetical protein
MSGILGAGSKSGKIGQTELEYEEGNWTPTNNGGNTGFCGQYGRYVRVGKVVHVTTYFALDNSGIGDTAMLGGLPYPATDDTNAHYALQGHFQFIHDQSANDKWHVMCRFRPGDAFLHFYKSGNNTAFVEHEIDNESIGLSGTYMIN